MHNPPCFTVPASASKADGLNPSQALYTTSSNSCPSTCLYKAAGRSTEAWVCRVVSPSQHVFASVCSCIISMARPTASSVLSTSTWRLRADVVLRCFTQLRRFAKAIKPFLPYNMQRSLTLNPKDFECVSYHAV